MTPILLLAIGAGHSVQILKRYYEEYARAKADHPELTPAEHNRHRGDRSDGQGRRRHARGGHDRVAQLRLARRVRAAVDQELRALHGVRHRGGADRRDDVHPGDSRADVAAVARSRPSASRTQEYFDPILEKLARVVRERKRAADPVGLRGLILIVAAVGATRLKGGQQPRRAILRGNAPVRGFRMADSRMAGTRVIQVLVEGKTPGRDQGPRGARSAWMRSRRSSRKQPLPVGKVVSIVDVLKQMSRAIATTRRRRTLPDTSEGSRSTSCSTRCPATTPTWPAWSIATFERAVITAYIKTDDFRR